MKGKYYWKARDIAAQVIVLILALACCYYFVKYVIELFKALLKAL